MRSTGIGLVHAAERVGKVNRIGIGVTLAGKLEILRSRSRIWRNGIDAAHRFAKLPAYVALELVDRSLKAIIRWCKARKLIRKDPTFDIKVRVPKSDGHHTWTDDEVAQFEAAHPIGSKPRLALALGLYTALRREDAVRIGRQHFRDGVLTVRPKKTETTTRVTLAIPVHPELQAIIDATPTGHLTLLVTETGKSYGGDAFSRRFREWCDEADLPQRCVFHGLRKAALTWLAQAGCTPHEIMAISGHNSLEMVEHYTRKVEQARLAQDAMAKRERREQTGSESVKSQPAAVSKPLSALTKNAG